MPKALDLSHRERHPERLSRTRRARMLKELAEVVDSEEFRALLEAMWRPRARKSNTGRPLVDAVARFKTLVVSRF